MKVRAWIWLALIALWFPKPAAAEDSYILESPAVESSFQPTCQPACQPGCSSCDSCCDSCCDWCNKCPLFGFIQATDTRWANFISPMTNPVFFEDPRTLSEVRFIFAEHHIPSLAGGAIPASDIQVLAMQARAAITEDLSIIATKDGFIWASPNAPLDDGGGLKSEMQSSIDSK